MIAGVKKALGRVYRSFRRSDAPADVDSPAEPAEYVDPNPFPVDAWCQQHYPQWFEEHRAKGEELERQRELSGSFSYQPTFSFIVPLYKTPHEYLHTMADSVLAQTYPNLQLVLVNASPEIERLAAEVAEYAAQDSRVTVVTLEKNLGITENTNEGLKAATGDFCCFLDHDDYIDTNLLFEYVKLLNEDSDIDVLYCDEDLVKRDASTGEFAHQNPLFKPDYSPELLLCKNFIIHLMTIRRSILQGMPRPTVAFDGSQDFNMILYATFKARKVSHVPKVLYHWRISENSTATNPDSKPYSLYSCRKAISAALERREIGAEIIGSGIYLLHNLWLESPNAKVSVICDDFAQKNASRFGEFFNQNCLSEGIEVIHTGTSEKNRYARLNKAAAQATGDYLVFLDAGCYFETPEPLQQLTAMAALDGVGIASPKTLYRNGRNKTYGVAVTPERIMPLYRGYEDDFPGYQCNIRAFQNASACGLQGLTISRELFESAGGFDEDFEGEIGAAELCHRVLATGKRIAQMCTVKLHTDDECPERFFVCSENAPDYLDEDLALFDSKWPGAREAGDPYLNANLDQSSSYFQIPEL